ncbi:MAG: hypothetical protein WC061_04690, partial [Melioribacteraceae bacterium]
MSIKLKIFILFIFLFQAARFTAQTAETKIYKAAEGKNVGIWPHNDRFKSIEKMRELNTKWGFNHLLLAAIYDGSQKEFLADAGFDSLHIAYQIHLPDMTGNREIFYKKLLELGKIWGYYFDEPISREHSYREFLNLLIFMSENGLYPHSRFIVSELDEKKAERVSLFVDDITYSGYGNKDGLGFDQIKTWAVWKDYLGSKFGMPWISSDLDSNEYRTLFKAARDLKFNFV